jgi:xylulose-5-phosphate/fructose-6-phosphate phosphoketolase
MYPDKHLHGMDEMFFNALFTESAPVIFAFHNNRWLIHTLVHGRSHERRFRGHDYIDQGTTTTPFDMVVLNEMSRFHLVLDALKHIPRLRVQAANAIEMIGRKLNEHHDYIRQHLEEMPEIRNWQWTVDFSESATPAPLAKGHPSIAIPGLWIRLDQALPYTFASGGSASPSSGRVSGKSKRATPIRKSAIP